MSTNSGGPESPRKKTEDRSSPAPLSEGASARANPPESSHQMELAFEHRSSAVFGQWLRSMTTDAEAALAAAMSYRELSPSGREHWLASLREDLRELDIPNIAVYAPLLAVETDPDRRRRLEELAAEDDDRTEVIASRAAFASTRRNGERVIVLVVPLYLQFVQVLACAIKDGCFSWVRHDPIVSKLGAPVAGDMIQGIRLELAGFSSALDELASTILSHQRKGHELPEAMYVLSDLLGGIGP